jgi:hypothetical protein
LTFAREPMTAGRGPAGTSAEANRALPRAFPGAAWPRIEPRLRVCGAVGRRRKHSRPGRSAPLDQPHPPPCAVARCSRSCARSLARNWDQDAQLLDRAAPTGPPAQERRPRTRVRLKDGCGPRSSRICPPGGRVRAPVAVARARSRAAGTGPRNWVDHAEPAGPSIARSCPLASVRLRDSCDRQSSRFCPSLGQMRAPVPIALARSRATGTRARNCSTVLSRLLRRTRQRCALRSQLRGLARARLGPGRATAGRCRSASRRWGGG